MSNDQLFKMIKLGERLTVNLNAAAEQSVDSYFSINTILLDVENSQLALHGLLDRSGIAVDSVQLPHASISVTHSGGRTIGVDVRSKEQALQSGTGIDYERNRKVDTRAARFFLQPSELEWLTTTSKAQRNFHLLRLWTIKEALYKADATNRTESRFIGQYETENPAQMFGTAKHRALPGVRFIYATTDLDDGLVSLAVALKC